MRRKDREVSDINEIIEIVHKSRIVHVGLYDADGIYIVPLNFGYEFEDNSLAIYFHSAPMGKKIDLIKANPNVGFEMECDCHLAESDTACGHSEYYRSLIGNGIAEIITDADSKKHALEKIMEHYTEKTSWDFSEDMVNVVSVIKVNVNHMSAKKHIP